VLAVHEQKKMMGVSALGIKN